MAALVPKSNAYCQTHVAEKSPKAEPQGKPRERVARNAHDTPNEQSWDTRGDTAAVPLAAAAPLPRIIQSHQIT